MTRDIRRRLQKLESQISHQPTDEEIKLRSWQRLMLFAVAYYLGNARKSESPMKAYARALGYEDESEFLIASGTNDPNVIERTALAKAQLLAKFGVNVKGELAVIGKAFDQMKNGLYESYRRRC